MRWQIFIAVCCLGLAVNSANADLIVGVDWASDQDNPFVERESGIEVSWGGEPIPVGPNPEAPAWTKVFDLLPGIENPSRAITVVEQLLFVDPRSGPFLPVVAWHEEILAPDFVWLDGTMDQLDLSGGFIQTIANGVVSGASIAFQFSPIVDDQSIYRITKRLSWVGQGSRPGIIEVREFPAVVPEPSAFAFFALLATCIGWRGLWRRLR